MRKGEIKWDFGKDVRIKIQKKIKFSSIKDKDNYKTLNIWKNTWNKYHYRLAKC